MSTTRSVDSFEEPSHDFQKETLLSRFTNLFFCCFENHLCYLVPLYWREGRHLLLPKWAIQQKKRKKYVPVFQTLAWTVPLSGLPPKLKSTLRNLSSALINKATAGPRTHLQCVQQSLAEHHEPFLLWMLSRHLVEDLQRVIPQRSQETGHERHKK